MTEIIIAFIKLIRPVNFLITFVSVIVAGIICLNGIFPAQIIFLAALSAALTSASGNIINDIFDIEIDKTNRPERPLASKKISKNSAMAFYLTLILASLTLAWFINLSAFIIVLTTTIILFIYSKYLKRFTLIGNIVIAFLTGLVFIFGGVAAENPSAAIIPAVFAFLINLIREIVKDIQDVEGDKKAGVTTFPIRYGFKSSRLLILLLTLLLILFTFFPFITKLYKIEFFILVMVIVNPVLVYCLKLLFENNSLKNLSKVSNLLKIDMVIGLIAIYFGV